MEGLQNAWGHLASEWPSQDLNPGNPTPGAQQGQNPPYYSDLTTSELEGNSEGPQDVSPQEGGAWPSSTASLFVPCLIHGSGPSYMPASGAEEAREPLALSSSG